MAECVVYRWYCMVFRDAVRFTPERGRRFTLCQGWLPRVRALVSVPALPMLRPHLGTNPRVRAWPSGARCVTTDHRIGRTGSGLPMALSEAAQQRRSRRGRDGCPSLPIGGRDVTVLLNTDHRHRTIRSHCMLSTTAGDSPHRQAASVTLYSSRWQGASSNRPGRNAVCSSSRTYKPRS